MNETSPGIVDLNLARIGRVVSVSGSQLIGLMDQSLGSEESPVRRPDIGEVVNVRTATTIAFGLVTGLSIPIPEQIEGKAELRIMELELIGEIESDGVFRRGVSTFPPASEASSPRATRWSIAARGIASVARIDPPAIAVIKTKTAVSP